MRFFPLLLCAWIPLSVAAGPIAQFRTSIGEIDVELLDQDKPLTVQNFIHYVESGLYQNNMFFHRWDPGFVIQGGGFYTSNRHATNQTLSQINPFPTIPNEYSVGRTFSNTYGTLAMARESGKTNSANSQWYFNLGDNSELDAVDGGFTVFGRVVGGTNVLNRFQKPITGNTNGVYKLSLGFDPFQELPVLTNQVTWTSLYDYLVYVDITLLHVEVTPITNGGRDISWSSVADHVNHVEFTPQFPPTWQELYRTKGNGQTLHVTDPSEDASERFYRVRVDY